MKTIRFTEDRHFTRTGEHFKAGAVHTLKDDQAARWVRRNAAVYVDDVEAVEVTSVEVQVVEVAPEVQPEEKVEQAQVDGDAVDNSADMEKSDGGDTSVGAVDVKPRGRGRPAAKYTGNRNK